MANSRNETHPMPFPHLRTLQDEKTQYNDWSASGRNEKRRKARDLQHPSTTSQTSNAKRSMKP
jgi:hypothetical protein